MKVLRVMLIILILFGVSVLSPGCASDSAEIPEEQVLTVQRGDLRTDITGVGNLALSHKVDLAFEMDGTVEEVLIEEGKSVEEGQLLANLDTLAWEENIAALEEKVITAERNVTAKERAVTAAERKVRDAERQVTTKMRDLLQAQINLNNAKLSLEQTEEVSTDRLEIEMKELQVELAEGKLEDAQIALDDAANEGIADAKIAVDDAKVAVEDAKKALEDAKEALAEVVAASPEVKAPFDGFITSVNIAGGDEVKKGTVAVTIADPTKFEAEVMVSEMNILQVKLGGGRLGAGGSHARS
ncbi:HlyD family secretion protein [Chloroflexota bacterium]